MERDGNRLQVVCHDRLAPYASARDKLIRIQPCPFSFSSLSDGVFALCHVKMPIFGVVWLWCVCATSSLFVSVFFWRLCRAKFASFAVVRVSLSARLLFWRRGQRDVDFRLLRSSP